MKRLYFLQIVFLLSLFTIRAQSLEGSFTILGEESVTQGEVSVSAIAGQSFFDATDSERLGYGFIEILSAVLEQSEGTEDSETLTLDQHSLVLHEGETRQLTAGYTTDVSNTLLQWYSSDESVAIVNEGLVHAVRSGNAVITVTSASGIYSADCHVEVLTSDDPDPEPEPIPDPIPEPVPVTGVTLDQASLSLVKGEQYTLSVTVKPDNADNKAVTWYSTNEAVASVHEGLVTALGVGEATIRVYTINGGFSASCTLTVTDPTANGEIMAEGICLIGGVLHVELAQPQPVRIFDTAGNLIIDVQGAAGSNRISLQHCPGGIYFVLLQNRVFKMMKP